MFVFAFWKKHTIYCALKNPKRNKVWSWRFVSLVSFPADYTSITQTWVHFCESKVKGIRQIIGKQTFMQGNFCPNVFTFSENKTTVKQSLCFVFCIACVLTIPWKPHFWWIFLEYLHGHGFSTSDCGGGNDWEQWLGTSQPIKTRVESQNQLQNIYHWNAKGGNLNLFFFSQDPFETRIHPNTWVTNHVWWGKMLEALGIDSKKLQEAQQDIVREDVILSRTQIFFFGKGTQKCCASHDN